MIFYQKQYDAVYTYHADAQGNVVAISGENGTVLEKYAYDVYGRLTGAEIWDAGEEEFVAVTTSGGFVSMSAYYAASLIDNEIFFQGRQYDRESGLYYFRNRYYDPATGRFISRDPAGPVDGPNLYAFVNNNPINYVDPMGLEAKKLFVVSWPTVPDGTNKQYKQMVEDDDQVAYDSDESNAEKLYVSSIADLKRQIEDILQQGHTIECIKFFGHGIAGEAQLGDKWIKESDWASFATLDSTKTWPKGNDMASYFEPDARIIFYGCLVGYGEWGRNFMREVANKLLHVNGGSVYAAEPETEITTRWYLFDSYTYVHLTNSLAHHGRSGLLDSQKGPQWLKVTIPAGGNLSLENVRAKLLGSKVEGLGHEIPR